MSDSLSESRPRAELPTGYEGRKRHERATKAGERPPSLLRAVAPERLFAAAKTLRSRGGAAGRDGVRPRDLTEREAGEIGRRLSELARRWKYVPSRTRAVNRKKPGGGTRTIEIESTASNQLSSALHESLTPYCNRRGVDASYGWRRDVDGRKIFGLLAAAVAEGRTWLLHDDIRRFFDELPVDVAVELLREHFGGRRGLAELLESVVRRHPAARRPLGIPQGNALSPLVANLVLDAKLDRPLLAAGLPVTYARYADNLLFLAAEAEDSLRARDHAAELLTSIGLTLKGEDPPVDLAAGGKPPMLLGFGVAAEGGRLRLSVPGKAWKSLKDKLAASHTAADPTRVATGMFAGWIEQYGPAVPEDVDGFVNRVFKAARKAGVREYDSDFVTGLAVQGRTRWQEFLREAADGE